MYSSVYNSKSRGVSIFVRKNLNLVVRKSQTDQEGKWVCLDTQLDNQKINIMNIYAPNVLSPNFLHEICNAIRTIGNHNIIPGRDFNQVRDNQLDRSGDRQGIPQTCTSIDTIIDELSLVNIWCVLHPLEKDFTFYFHPHQSHSRIDCILVSRSLLNQTQNAAIGNIFLSDHAPVDLIKTSLDIEDKTIACDSIIHYCKMMGDVLS